MTTLTDAVVDTLNNLLPRVYRTGAVPQSPSYPYLIASTTFDSAQAYRNDATHGVGQYRVTTQSVSTSEAGAEAFDAMARGALLDQRIAVDGKTYGPGVMQVGAALVRDPDGGSVITITSTYLFGTEE